MLLVVEKLSFQALSSKRTITELSLAENQLGVQGAMVVVRKAGPDVERVHMQCGESNTSLSSTADACSSSAAKRSCCSTGCDKVMT